MLDNLNEGSNESSVEVSAEEAFYGKEEPSEPTQEAVEKGETEDLEDSEESEADGQPQTDDDDSDEVLVFDKPNDFAKYEYDEESGLYQFRSNGKTVKANIEKLINSFQADQKLNIELENLAKAKKGEFDTARQKEIEVLQSEAAKFKELSDRLESLVKDTDEKIDWDELRDLDPSEYLKQKELQAKRKEALESSRSENQRKAQERMSEVRAVEAQKLKESIPEWKDEKVMTKDVSVMRDHVFDLGFTQEEIDLISDHRFWLLIKDSSELKRIKTKEVKEVKKIPASTKSVRSSTPKKAEERSLESIFYGN